MTASIPASRLPATTSNMPPASSWYIYAVVPTTDTLVFDVAGIDPADDTVLTLPASGLAAVVGRSQRADFRGMARDDALRALLAHQRVTEAVLREYPLLPVKFGTTLPDQAAVERLLALGAAQFQAAFARLGDCEQHEVVVLWDLPAVFQAIGSEPAVVALREQLASLPAEQAAAGRVALGKLVKERLEAQRAGLQAQIVPALRGLARQVVSNPLMDDSMVANLALLLDDSGIASLAARLEALDSQTGGALRFRVVGPLPPHSFATVEAQVLPFAAVDAARQLLGLAEVVPAAAIRQAYRRLAAAAHPDANPTADAAAQLDALVQAQALLLALAQAQQTGQVDFSPQAVAQTVLVQLPVMA